MSARMNPATDLAIHLERLLDTSPDVAFAAWADPAARQHWYAPHHGWYVEATTDLRVGGKWFAKFGPTKENAWTEDGEFLEVDPPHRMSYTDRFTFPDGRNFTTIVTVSFTAVDGKTLLTLDDVGYPNEQDRADHEGGWPDFINAYERYLASLG